MVSRLARPRVLIPIAIVVVLVGMGVWMWARAGSSTGVSAEQARAAYGAGATGEAIPGGPRAGVWTYAATGDESVGLGPVDVERALPTQATVVVRPAAGGYWRTLVLSEEHVEASRFRVGPQGAYLVERVTTVTVAGFGRDDRQRLVPPPLVHPRGIAVGDTWREHYSLAEVTVDARVRVLRREVLRVEDTDVPTFLVETDAVITGPLPGTRVDRMWWSPDLQMPVRWTLAMDIHGIASLRTDAEAMMTGTGPE